MKRLRTKTHKASRRASGSSSVKPRKAHKAHTAHKTKALKVGKRHSAVVSFYRAGKW